MEGEQPQQQQQRRKEYCRLCLIKFERRFMIPIFSLATRRLELQIRSVVSSIQMGAQDEFSQCVCIECALKVSTAFNFMQFCAENQKLLRSPHFDEALLVEATDTPPEPPQTPPVFPSPLRSSPAAAPLPPPPPLTSSRRTSLSPSSTARGQEEEEEEQLEEAEEGDGEVAISSLLECQLGADEDEAAADAAGALPDLPPSNPYKCSVCARPFGKKANVLSHFQTQHPRLEVPSAWKYDIEPTQCPLCGVRVECLRAHLEHHAGRRAFKCDRCEWAFYSKNYLHIHVAKLHAADAALDARPDRFACKQCPAGSGECRDYDALVAHYRQWHQHEPRSPLETCAECGKETRHLRAHMEKAHHAAAGQFACRLCDKSYAKARYLQTHLTTAHKEQQPQQQQQQEKAEKAAKRPRVQAGGPVHCVKCQMQFPSNRMLNMHIQRYHNAPLPLTTATAEVSVTVVGDKQQQPPPGTKKRRMDSGGMPQDMWNNSALTGMLVNMFGGGGGVGGGKRHYED